MLTPARERRQLRKEADPIYIYIFIYTFRPRFLFFFRIISMRVYISIQGQCAVNKQQY